MQKVFIFFYLNIPDGEKVGEVVPAHVEYWKSRKTENQMEGPFTDKSGGMILFSADSMQDAMKIVADDPFVQNNLLDKQWVKEWNVE